MAKALGVLFKWKAESNSGKEKPFIGPLYGKFQFACSSKITSLTYSPNKDSASFGKDVSSACLIDRLPLS